MNNKKAIGIFDSGFGGLTVMSEIIKEMPNENIVYFGDNARAPYGNKSSDLIKKYSLQDANFLLSKNIKVILIACNTASSYSISFLKKKIKNIPIYGVLETGALACVSNTKNNKVGIIATNATVKSDSYFDNIKNINNHIEIYQKACPLLVPIVEEGFSNKKIIKEIVSEYLKFFDNKSIDTLMLGCTHYPILFNYFSEYFGKNINIINSGFEIAKKLRFDLETLDLINISNKKPKYSYFTSDDAENFIKISSLFMDNISSVKNIKIENY